MSPIQSQQFHSIYQSLSELSVIELDEMMNRIVSLRRQKLPTVLSQVETELLQKINAVLPPTIQKRYDFLLKKRREETLGESEYQELLELTSYTENHTNQRLTYLLGLAKVRNRTLDEIIADLEMKPRLYVTCT